MTIVPIRDIGKLGVNTDWSPVDLPVEAWTMGSNVRFCNNRIQRGPIFSKVGNLILNTSPSYCISYKLLNNSSQFLVLNTNGTITNWQASTPGSNPTETNISPSSYTPSSNTAPFTATICNDVVYVNRADRAPWYKTTGGSQFAVLPVWDSTWTCGALRSFNDTLVAINLIKGGVSYPTMVKTSDFVLYDTTPGAWVAATTNSATENVLGDLQDPLIDGLALRDRFILYAQNETWVMTVRGDALVYNYSCLFKNRGIINQNCVAEYNNTHYVFGNDDIWTHDGYGNKSIALGRVRDFIYNNLVRSQRYQFFVVNNAKQGEVMFCYVSADPYCYFPISGTIGYPGCNRAAVYNYIFDTWYFYDLPYITGAAVGVTYSGSTYNNMVSLTYDSVGGTYNSYYDGSQLFLQTVGTSIGSVSSSVRLFEAPNIALGSGVLDTVATAPVYLENKLMDMDEIAKELRGYKIVNQMWPEATFASGAPVMTFTWGSSDAPNTQAVYDHDMTFDGVTLNKLDFNAPGKYLSLKITYSGTQDFQSLWLGY
jgi:hypothetical protein